MHPEAQTIDLLDQIHTAILNADFARLSSLSVAVETSLAQASPIKDAQTLQKIQGRAERNAACLLAAGRGIRAAQRRIAELRDAKQGFSTYTKSGQRAQHDQPSQVARRY